MSVRSDARESEEDVWTTEFAAELLPTSDNGPNIQQDSVDATEDRLIVGIYGRIFNSVDVDTQAVGYLSLGGNARPVEGGAPGQDEYLIVDKGRAIWETHYRYSSTTDVSVSAKHDVDVWDSDGIIVWEENVTMTANSEVSTNPTTDNVAFLWVVYWKPLEEVQIR